MLHLYQMKLCKLLLFFFLGIQTWAQSNTAIFSGLNVFGSARIASLGGSAIALPDGDVHFVTCNPALIDSSMHGNLAMSYVRYFAQSNFGYSSIAYHKPQSKWAYAATMQYFNYGESERLDGLGNPIGSFSNNEYALHLGASYAIDSLWKLGANLKNMYAVYDVYDAYALGVDLGATYYKSSSRFAASLVCKNAGIQLSNFTSQSREKLPFELQIGISKQPKNAPFRFHLVYENLQKFNITYTDANATVIVDPLTGEPVGSNTWKFGDDFMRHIVLGTELLFGKNFKLAVGYNYRQRKELAIPNKPSTAGFSFGATMQFKKFELSYGRSIYHVAGGSNHISLTTRVF
jgi:hypothetical protein